MSALLPLPAIDGVEITTIIDNALDLLMASTPVAKRFPLHRELLSPHQLRAEHGVSLLVTAINHGKWETILFDTGVTPVFLTAIVTRDRIRLKCYGLRRRHPTSGSTGNWVANTNSRA